MTSAKKCALITDLDDQDTIGNVKLLLGEDLAVMAPGAVAAEAVVKCADGLVVILKDAKSAVSLKELLEKYAKAGGTAVVDIAAFASLYGFPLKPVDASGIKVVVDSPLCSGFRKGQVVPYGAKTINGLADLKPREGLAVLGTVEPGLAALVELKVGAGKIVAADFLSLPEPCFQEKGGFYKYLFLINAVGNRFQYGEFYERKLDYAEFVGRMREVEKQYPGIVTVKEEGDATGGLKMYSLNLGDPKNTGIFIFGATHGDEWLCSFGLLTLVKYLAAHHQDQKLVDFKKYHLKVLPINNPYGFNKDGYRFNANRVDVKSVLTPVVDKPQTDAEKAKREPFSEPEMKTYRNILENNNFRYVLNFHEYTADTRVKVDGQFIGNKMWAYSNSVKRDNGDKVKKMQELFNASTKGRYLFKPAQDRKDVAFGFGYEYLRFARITSGGSEHMLYTMALQGGKYGFLMETIGELGPAKDTYMTTLTNDEYVELCLAFFQAFLE